MTIEAMKQALEALEPYARQIVDQGKDYEMVKCDPKVDAAITVLRTAIEEAEKKSAQSHLVGLEEKDFSAIVQSCLTKIQAAMSAESILKEKNT